MLVAVDTAEERHGRDDKAKQNWRIAGVSQETPVRQSSIVSERAWERVQHTPEDRHGEKAAKGTECGYSEAWTGKNGL